jgi:hypothetical protein
MATLDLVAPTPGLTDPEVIATAADWESFFRAGLLDGVIEGMKPSLDAAGRNAVLAAGSAFVRAYIAVAETSNATPIAAPSGASRVDRLVLRLDRTQTSKTQWIVPTVIPGTPGSNPQPPALQASASAQWDLPVARWTSAASGALTGLVDERVLLGGPVMMMATQGARPPQSRPGLLIDQGAGSLLISPDGVAWSTVWQPPDAWHPLLPGGSPFSSLSGWGVPRYRLAPDRSAVQFAGTLKGSGAQQLATIATLPAGYFDTVQRATGITVESTGGSAFTGSWVGLDVSGHLAITTAGTGGWLAFLDGLFIPINT